VLEAEMPVEMEPEPAEEESEAVAALNVLSRLLEGLQCDLINDMELSEIMPLLTSSRTLLEMAGDKAKKQISAIK